MQAWGSKKSNMNHLLNFHFEARHYRDYHGVGHYGYGVRRVSGCMLPYNKERFLQAKYVACVTECAIGCLLCLRVFGN